MSRKEFRELVPPGDVNAQIEEFDLSVGSETVELSAVCGRVLAERVDAGIDVPGFDRASMDGYAVRARDTFGASETDPVKLELLGEVHAGAEPGVEGAEGGAIEISTGAVMPPGTDAVVMVERTEEVDDSVRVSAGVAPGDHVMAAGTDIAAGVRALGAGTEISPREIGLLSAVGREVVPVFGKPTVGIVSTGDELVVPGEQLDHSAGEIYDVNSYTIAAGVEEAGGESQVYPLVEDTYDAMHECFLTAAEECDLLLSSGSTSAGAVDLIHEIIEAEGELLIHGVAVKPGKPMMIGELTGTPFIGLPGYPVSALTIYQYFVAPHIRDAAGISVPPSLTVEGRMGVRERYGEGRLRFMPVGVIEDSSGQTIVYPVDKGSGATTSLVEGDGFVEMPPEVAELHEGDTVTVTLFSESVRPPTVLCVGEDDPVFSEILDELDRPRFLHVGSTEGARRLSGGVPDAAVVSGPVDSDGEVLGAYYREWGIVVEKGNPQNITGIESLVDQDVTFVNRFDGAGIRASFEAKLAAYTDAHETSLDTVKDRIVGYENGVKGHASPARNVIRGVATAGLGLRVTAESLGLDFISLGYEPVRIVGNPARREKQGVTQLTGVLDETGRLVRGQPGYYSEPPETPTSNP